MSRSVTYEAIVLATHNVGEADRFCILFTKEQGKIAARARGVRKPKSKMGGSLLPMQHLSVHMRESSAGWIVSDVSVLSDRKSGDIDAFLPMQQGTELLLSILHDQQPLPELYASALRFYNACCTQQEYTVLPFTIELLSVMGLLPSTQDDYFRSCSQTQLQFMQESSSGNWQCLPSLTKEERTLFSALLAPLLSQISATPLKTGGVISDIRAAHVL